MFAEEELVCIAVLLMKRKNHRKGSGYMPVCWEEKTRGNILLCIKNLQKIPSGLIIIKECRNLFLNLLFLVEEDLQKKNKTFRETMSPRKNSAVCSR
jgi:hypothetical protein